MQLHRKRKVVSSSSTGFAQGPSVSAKSVGGTLSAHKQRHRAIANARERDRTESVNYAFTMLRSLLPTDPPNRKLSKIEVLRLATSYIQHLDNVRSAIFQGNTTSDICAKSGKSFCTFCITASKNTCVAGVVAPTQVKNTAAADHCAPLVWTTFDPCSGSGLLSVELAATDALHDVNQQQSLEQVEDVIYAELENAEQEASQTEAINFNWNSADFMTCSSLFE